MSIAICLLALLGCLALLFWGVDWYLSFMIWQRRIHIGRWEEYDHWIEKVKSVCLHWLIHSPTVKLTDRDRLVLWDILKGRYRIQTIQSWQEAGLLLGLLDTKETSSKVFNQYISQKINLKTGKWIIPPVHIDGALLGYVLMKQSWIDPKLIYPALDELYQLILNLKGEQNTVPYRKQLPDVRFVDTLGFICPFLLKYGLLFRNENAVVLAYNQILEYDQALLHDSAIPAHAYHLTKQCPMGIYDWGRGIGWYIIALTEMYDIQIQHELSDIFFLKKRIAKLGEEMLLYQLPEGGFSEMFFNEQGMPESSSTVLSGLLMSTCYTITQDVKYKKSALAAISQLMCYTQRNGCIDLCQGDTKGIGYYSQTFTYMPFVQGLTLRLALLLKDI